MVPSVGFYEAAGEGSSAEHAAITRAATASVEATEGRRTCVVTFIT